MKIGILLTLLWLSSCSSRGPFTEPPDKEEVASIKKNLNSKKDFLAPQSSSGERHAELFLQANYFLKSENLHHACKRYEFLSKDESFALKELAWLRSLLACDYPEIKYQKLWSLEKEQVSKWLMEEYLKTSLEIAKRKKMTKFQAIFLNRISKYERVKKVKVEKVKEALEIARSTNEDELTKEITERLHMLAPRLQKKYDSAQRFKIGRDYERVRDFEKARIYYRKIVRDPKEDINTKKMAWNRLRLSYKLQRQKPTYVLKTKKMVRFFKRRLLKSPKDSSLKKIWVETSIKYARALWTLHRRDEGRAVLKKLLAYGVNNKDFLAQIHWILGKMKIEEKKFKEALEQFEIANELDFKSEALKEKLVWSLGWNTYQMGGYQKVISIFGEYLKKSSSHGLNLKLKFWMAKAYQKIKMEDEYEDLLEEIIENDSFGYYGIISHMELKEELDPIDIPEQDDYHEDPTFEWLVAMEEFDLSQNYLKQLQKRFKKTEEILSILPLYERSHWYEGGIFKFFKIKSEGRNSALQKFPTSAFPIPFKELAQKAGERFGLSVDLIFSIIRQESAFNPVIRSWADAFGLMQLIPERAKKLSVNYQIPYKKLEDLYDPDINLKLGAALLSELREKYNKNFIQYVASYNASERVVQKWFKRNWDGDPIKFIEMIPYKETRGYVKLVFRNLITYRRLLSEDSFLVTPEMLTDI